MSNKYQYEFMKFLTEVKKIPDAQNAEYNMSQDILNVVVISGEIRGSDTREIIDKAGQEQGLIVMAQDLSVLFRENEIDKL